MHMIKKWVIRIRRKYNYNLLCKHSGLLEPIEGIIDEIDMDYEGRIVWLNMWCMKHYDTIYYLNGENCSVNKALRTMRHVVQCVANILFYGTMEMDCNKVSNKLVYISVKKANPVKWNRLNNILYYKKPKPSDREGLIFTKDNNDIMQKTKDRYNLFIK